jgi:hypothetical protein
MRDTKFVFGTRAQRIGGWRTFVQHGLPPHSRPRPLLRFDSPRVFDAPASDRRRIVAGALRRTADKALEATAGSGYFRALGLERILRDAQAAQFHPMPEIQRAGLANFRAVASLDRKRLGQAVLWKARNTSEAFSIRLLDDKFLNADSVEIANLHFFTRSRRDVFPAFSFRRLAELQRSEANAWSSSV